MTYSYMSIRHALRKLRKCYWDLLKTGDLVFEVDVVARILTIGGGLISRSFFDMCAQSVRISP